MGTEKYNLLRNDIQKAELAKVSNLASKFASISLNGTNANEIMENSVVKNYENKISNNFMGLSAIDVTKTIYNNSNFYDYLKYSFLGKYFQKKIDFYKKIIMILALIIIGLLYLLLGMGIPLIIISIILIIASLFIIKQIDKSETYKSYYNRTMCNIVLGSFKDSTFTLNTETLTDADISQIISKKYTKKENKNMISYTGKYGFGNISDLKLIETVERQNKQTGEITKSDVEVFEGFRIKINFNKSMNKLRGNVIKIRDDEGVISSVTEDTINGIFDNKLDYTFNSEELNKSLDCRISGYSGFDDIDQMHREITKIITPTFEKHLLFLRERYNSFNMNISDNYISLSFNMDRSFFQKIKHDEIFKLGNNYREENIKFNMIEPSTSGITDFSYYKVLPVMERLYLFNYLTYLYLSYMDDENYFSINSDALNLYETEIKEIYTMEYEDLKNLYNDRIKQIKEETNDFAQTFSMQIK